MLRRLLFMSAVCVWVNSLWASDADALDKKSKHPTAKPDSEVVALAHDALFHVARYSDVATSLAYLQTCKAANSQSEDLLLAQSPRMYQERGLPTEIFFPFDHPQWTPEALPKDTALALHKVFFQARKVRTTDPRAAFKSFYAVGCFGHRLGALEAGKMLLDPALNEVLPAFVSFEDLDPALEVEEWGIHRLNQSAIPPELEEIVENTNRIWEEEGTLDKPQMVLKILSDSLDKVHKVSPETDETKAVKICVKELIEHYQNHKTFDGLDLQETKAFVKTLSHTSVFLQSLFKDEAPQPPLTLGALKFNGLLNDELLSTHIARFNKKIYKTREKNSSSLIPVRTPQARRFVKKIIPMQHVSVLLSQHGSCVVHHLQDWFHPITENKEWKKEEEKFQQISLPIETFLHHLAATRFLNAKYVHQGEFDVALSRIESALRNGNVERSELFKAAFSEAMQGKVTKEPTT